METKTGLFFQCFRRVSPVTGTLPNFATEPGRVLLGGRDFALLSLYAFLHSFPIESILVLTIQPPARGKSRTSASCYTDSTPTARRTSSTSHRRSAACSG